MLGAVGMHAQLEARHEALVMFRSPWWLRSTHGSSLLVVDFGGRRQCEVSLNFELPSGRRLTSSRKLVDEIYDYLCCQSLTKRGNRPRDAVSAWKHFIYSLNVLDYFLLRDTGGHLAEHGFSALGVPAFNRFLFDIAKHQTTAEAVYQWRSKVKSHLLFEAKRLDDVTLQQVLAQAPQLSDIDLPVDQWTLTAHRSELIRVRALLWSQGLYRWREARVSAYTQVPSSALIARQVFANTLYGPLASFPGIASTFPELCMEPHNGYRREKAAVAVWAGLDDPRCNEHRFRLLRGKLEEFLPLSRMGIGPRLEVLEETLAVDFETLDEVDLKPMDGVRPAPPSAVAYALRQAIDFFYDHGDHLLTSTARVFCAAQASGIEPSQLSTQVFESLLSADTKLLGVNCWSIHTQLKLEDGQAPAQDQYLSTLRREHRGLWDLMLCLFGASLITVGVTQAGRNGELVDLSPADINQPGWLRLLTRKSRWSSARYQDYRPMPEVTSNILHRLHRFLCEIGFSDTALFRYPGRSGLLSPANGSAFAAATDLFLDLIEGECDADGRRYYLRQHQLRQFFAEAFFYCFGLKGLNTLRWFLRHLDPEQLWAYVEHTTPGAVLRRHKAAAAVSLLREQSSDLTGLVALLRRRFNVSRLEVLNDSELAEMIADLIEQGEVVITPVFAKTRRFEDMHLAVIVQEC